MKAGLSGRGSSGQVEESGRIMRPHRILRRYALCDERRRKHKTARNIRNRNLEARLQRRSPIGPNRYLIAIILFELRSLCIMVVMRPVSKMGMRESVVVVVPGVTRMDVSERSPNGRGCKPHPANRN